MSSALTIVSNAIEDARSNFQSVLADRSINFEREAGFALQAITASDYIMGVARGNRQSIVNAVTNIAAIGISLNPAKKQAYLVPRDGKICLDISYMGLMDLAMATGSVQWAQAAIVHEADGFTLNGYDRPPTHEFNPFAKDRGEPIGVYVVVKTADGAYLTHTMTTDAVNAIRDRSSAWRAWMTKKKSCPWVTDWAEMAKKTVVKQAYKYWPKTERLEKAMHHLNTDGDEGIVDAEAKPTIDVTPMIADALRTETDEGALAFWRANCGSLANDRSAYERLKQAVMDHRTKLRAKESAVDAQESPQGDEE